MFKETSGTLQCMPPGQPHIKLFFFLLTTAPSESSESCLGFKADGFHFLVEEVSVMMLCLLAPNGGATTASVLLHLHKRSRTSVVVCQFKYCCCCCRATVSDAEERLINDFLHYVEDDDYKNTVLPKGKLNWTVSRLPNRCY